MRFPEKDRKIPELFCQIQVHKTERWDHKIEIEKDTTFDMAAEQEFSLHHSDTETARKLVSARLGFVPMKESLVDKVAIANTVQCN